MDDRIAIDSAEAVGRLIRSVRIAADLTQVEAAALCGVSAPFLNGLEQGKATVQFGLLLSVCRGLGIRLFAELPQPLDLAHMPRRKPARRP